MPKKREYYCPVEGETFEKWADMEDHMEKKHPKDKIIPPDLDTTIRGLGLSPEQERRLREQVQLQPPTPTDEGVGWKPQPALPAAPAGNTPAGTHDAPPGVGAHAPAPAAAPAGTRVEEQPRPKPWPPGKVEPQRSPVWSRLQRALELIRLNSETKDAIWTMFTEDPSYYSNPTAMHNMMINLGADAHKAHWLVETAFQLTRSPNYGYPPTAGYAYTEPVESRSVSSPSPRDEAEEIQEMNREMNRAMMRWAMFLFQFRTMSQSLGTMMPGSADRVPVLHMNPDGSPAKDEKGDYVFDYVPATAGNVQVGLQKAESVDPMKLATALQDSFGRGMDAMSKAIEFATPKPSGGGTSVEQWIDRTMALQSKVHEKDLEAVKAQWGAIREVSAEREKMLMQQLESYTPERQAETIKKWKSLGLLNTGDIQATELQLKWELAKMRREDEKELAMAQANAQAAQAEADSRKFENLMNLATKTVTDAIQPVTVAIGDGLRARVSGRPPPQGGNPGHNANVQPQLPDFSSMTPEQRVAYRQNIMRARQLADEAESRINALES